MALETCLEIQIFLHQAFTDSSVAQWVTGKDALNNKDWPAFDLPSSKTLKERFQLEVVQPYRNAVAHCFDEKIHKIALSPGDEVDELAIVEKRKRLYELVVFPLENVIMKLGWAEAVDSMEPIPPALPPIQPPKSNSKDIPQRVAAEAHGPSSLGTRYLSHLILAMDTWLSTRSQNGVKFGPKNKGSFFFDNKSPGKDA